jgi:hypothetical protein
MFRVAGQQPFELVSRLFPALLLEQDQPQIVASLAILGEESTRLPIGFFGLLQFPCRRMVQADIQPGRRMIGVELQDLFVLLPGPGPPLRIVRFKGDQTEPRSQIPGLQPNRLLEETLRLLVL